MPHVCFINRVYPPTPGATGALLAELAPALVERGWRVTILTGPEDGEPPSETTADGVRVERVRALPFQSTNFWGRALAYGLLFPAFLLRALRMPSPDVFVTKTDPPMLKTLGPLLAGLTGARVVHWAQDLYPEVASEVGVISPEGVLARVMRWLSSWALAGHEHVVAVGRCMKERLTADRDLGPESVSVIPNWPPSVVEPVPRQENDFRAEHDLEERFIVMYSGNMGLAHPFDAVLDAAARLENLRPEVCVLFVGEGPRKASLQAEVERRGLTNVRFLPFQPRERLAESLSAANLHLVTMQPEMEGLVVPSKLYGALGVGRPVLFLGPEESEAARVVETADAGTVVPSPTGEKLADTIRDWRDEPEREQKAGRRAFATVGGARVEAADQFNRLLRAVVGEGMSSPTEDPPVNDRRLHAQPA